MNANGHQESTNERSGIRITGARQHNLKNLTLEIPRNRLVVITGPSGSGKSSLAFDTLFAEGQRRYVNSLSSYARQFLNRLDKPEVDAIEGLSPAVAIEQKTGTASPRSTIATTTEILDYLRVLYSSCGQPHHPETGAPLRRLTTEQVVDSILAEEEGRRFILMAPLIKDEPGDHKALLQKLRKDGFIRARIDGTITLLEKSSKLDRKRTHTLEVVIDRLKNTPAIRTRLNDSLELAFRLGQGIAHILWVNESGNEIAQWNVSNQNFDPETGYRFPKLTPRHFSFNNPLGACPVCHGLGTESILDDDLILPDPEKSLEEEPIAPWRKSSSRIRAHYRKLLLDKARHHKLPTDAPWQELPQTFRDEILYGSQGIPADTNEKGEMTAFPGVRPLLEKLWTESKSPTTRNRLQAFMSKQTCRSCGGARLRPEILSVTIESGNRNLNLHAFCEQTVEDAMDFLTSIRWPTPLSAIAEDLVREIRARLTFMADVGLGYLILNRETSTLSGGELQRIRLAGQIASRLTGVLYVLDEPSIGLHQRDTERLLHTLRSLRDQGNTVVVVEHDEHTMRAADHMIDLGPCAGPRGGYLIAEGSPAQILEMSNSPTGRFLKGTDFIPVPKTRKPPHKGYLRLIGAGENNLKNIDVAIPFGCFTCITGVSGSGKSTLVNDILSRALFRHFYQAKEKPGLYGHLSGLEELDRAILVDQSAIGRTPRSNALTYIGAFDTIRDLFAKLPASRIRGYSRSRFSFNTSGGRCEHCKGDGFLKIEMHFLPDAYVPCEACEGKRFNRETLEITYKGSSIADVLDMTVDEAITFFRNNALIIDKLDALSQIGLGYLRLGQPATTLSGGEAQRIKLATELSKKAKGRTCYILDEPTTGLHFTDIECLLEVFSKLREAGNTLVIIEHQLDIIKCADYIIDLGPEGGENGGEIVCSGTPEEVAQCEKSHTGRFLKTVLTGNINR